MNVRKNLSSSPKTTRLKAIGQTRAYTSRLTPRGQTVIPQDLREAMGLKGGDILRYELVNGKLVAEKLSMPALVEDDPFAFFTEWASPADDAAFAYLSDVVHTR